MEIIGLLMIVILLVVIMGVYIMFSSGPKSDVLGRSLVTVQSSNLLGALKSYTVCSGKDMDAVVEQCAKSDQVICGKKACTLFKETSESVLKAYYGKKKFDFFLEQPNSKGLVWVDGGLKCKEISGKLTSSGLKVRGCVCDGGRGALVSRRSISLYPGVVYMTLYKCA